MCIESTTLGGSTASSWSWVLGESSRISGPTSASYVPGRVPRETLAPTAMNLEESEKLPGPLQRLVDSGSRVNDLKPQGYWYPVSSATYGDEEILAAWGCLR